MNQWDDQMPGNRIFVRIKPRMQKIVPQFLKNAREDVDVLKSALEKADYESIARLGHSIKGAGGFGFDYLNQIGLLLEEAARIKALDKIGALVNDLEDYLDRVEPVYDAV